MWTEQQEEDATRRNHHTEHIPNMIVHPAMLYGMETVPMKKLEMTEVKMYGWTSEDRHWRWYHLGEEEAEDRGRDRCTESTET